VLDLVGKGKTSKEIADILGVSVFTVANHRKHICHKLNIHSTAELASYAAKIPGFADALHDNVPCEIVLNIRTRQGQFKMTYKGHLSQKPFSATVSIGSHILHF
jgi:hypothetical protein